MIMNPDAEVFAEVMTVICCSIAALTLITMIGRMLWKMGSRMSATPVRSAIASPDVQRLELAIDAIAVEVERISEGQRFTVALLSDALPRAHESQSLTAE